MEYEKKGLPFTFSGVTAVGDCQTAHDVLEKANLNWGVKMAKLYTGTQISNPIDPENAEMSYSLVQNTRAVVRTDNNKPLGVVKGRYNPVQNVNAFDFFDMVMSNFPTFEWFTAGILNDGARVFITAKISGVGVNVNGRNDDIDRYLIFINSHDGSTGVRVFISPVRVACFNALNAATKRATDYVSMRHTESITSRLQQAGFMMNGALQIMERARENYQIMANTTIKDKDAAKVICDLFLSDNERLMMWQENYPYQTLAEGSQFLNDKLELSTRKANLITRTYDYYHNGIGQQEIVGTAWGVYNAITGYYSNVDNSEGEKRMNSLLFGGKSIKIQQAGNTLLELAKVA